jgi:hypothetical protein
VLIVGLIAGLAVAAAPGSAQADRPAAFNGDSSCLACHENLYYLHDTGKWFCLNQPDMHCVYCHGGDDTTLDQAAAHLHRTAHPIVGDDTTTCQACHADSCAEHVQLFDRVAGINDDIRVASPLAPVTTIAKTPPAVVTDSAPSSLPWLLAGLALIAAGAGGWWLAHRR